MIHDWNGNGQKDDMFDNFMDYMMYKKITESNDDDDEDDEDYDEFDDDDDDRRSFGHHLVGFFKWIVGIAAVLVVAVITINFFYINGSAGFVDKLHDKLGDNNTAFELLFPCYELRAAMPSEEVKPEETPEPLVEIPTQAPATQQPDATVAIPNLDINTGAAPVIVPETVATQMPTSVG